MSVTKKAIYDDFKMRKPFGLLVYMEKISALKVKVNKIEKK